MILCLNFIYGEFSLNIFIGKKFLMDDANVKKKSVYKFVKVGWSLTKKILQFFSPWFHNFSSKVLVTRGSIKPRQTFRYERKS